MGQRLTLHQDICNEGYSIDKDGVETVECLQSLQWENNLNCYIACEAGYALYDNKKDDFLEESTWPIKCELGKRTFVPSCKKVCRGTNDGFYMHGTSDAHYDSYKDRYTNCSYVHGNLELTYLKGPYDLGFLSDIEEISGYVFIVNVYSYYLNLTKLRIVRGTELFHYRGEDFSLFVANNYDPFNDTHGLLELQLISLTEISRGKVLFLYNNLLCFENTIRWDDINSLTRTSVNAAFISKLKRRCPDCSEECYNRQTGDSHCWGSAPGMCQKLNFISAVCDSSCDGRCFGKEQDECCHPECAGGCVGPGREQCLACKNFYFEGSCHPYCPRMKMFDPSTHQVVNNPDGRYAFGSLCVKDCPRCEIPQIEHSEVSKLNNQSRSALKHGETIKVTCQKGFILSNPHAYGRYDGTHNGSELTLTCTNGTLIGMEGKLNCTAPHSDDVQLYSLSSEKLAAGTVINHGKAIIAEMTCENGDEELDNHIENFQPNEDGNPSQTKVHVQLTCTNGVIPDYDTLSCSAVNCKLNGSIEHGLTVMYKGLIISATAIEAIDHGESAVFNCESGGNGETYEPKLRIFKCDIGNWVVENGIGESWSLGNNGSFPECRPETLKPWKPDNSYYLGNKDEDLEHHETYKFRCNSNFELKQNGRYLSENKYNTRKVEVENLNGGLKYDERCFQMDQSKYPNVIIQPKTKYVEHGQSYHLSCENGYEHSLESDPDWTCSFGKLNGIFPHCTEKPCDTPAVKNGVLRNFHKKYSKPTIVSGDIVFLQCSQGFFLYDNSKNEFMEEHVFRIKCYRGNITSIPSCKKASRCELPNDPYASYYVNGEIYRGNNTISHKDKVDRVECESGTSLTKPLNGKNRCWDGNWKLGAELPVCEPDPCGLNEENGRHFISINGKEVESEVAHGNKVNVVCDDGDYDIVGNDEDSNSEIHCLKGKFDQMYHCVEISCEEEFILYDNKKFIEEGSFTMTCESGIVVSILSCIKALNCSLPRDPYALYYVNGEKHIGATILHESKVCCRNAEYII
ncbi:ERBB2-like protein [Mya arenaria]|uniref:receptor protein-tyrosine kinase n=1 Tax=Mya arenaria TaxID=6604 RepID=A0ABY7GAK3_MYAAR|nr:ERBB2-like protein [Mya arenaria]